MKRHFIKGMCGWQISTRKMFNIIRERKIKTIMRYYYTPLEQIKIKIVTTPKTDNHTEQLGLSYVAGRM